MRKDVIIHGRFAGYIDTQKKIFVTERDEAKHHFHMWNGLGYNQYLIDKFIETDQVKEVWTYYQKQKEKILLVATPLKIALRGVPWKNSKDIGDEQYVLALPEFEER